MQSRNGQARVAVVAEFSSPFHYAAKIISPLGSTTGELARSRDGRSVAILVGISRVPAYDIKLSARSPELVAMEWSQHSPATARPTIRSGEASWSRLALFASTCADVERIPTLAPRWQGAFFKTRVGHDRVDHRCQKHAARFVGSQR